MNSNAVMADALKTIQLIPMLAEGKDVRMTCAVPPHSARFELAPHGEERPGRLLVPTRQALEETVGGRAANSLLMTKSDTTTPDRFLLDPRFLSEYLSTSPASAAVPGTYNVQRPYSEEFGYFSSDGMFASSLTRHMLPPPDTREGTAPDFGIYELVSGFHDLLHGSFDFFEKHCTVVDLDEERVLGPMLFICKFREDEGRVFVEAGHCHTPERAKVRFAQFSERCGGPMNHVDMCVMRIKLDRWDFYEVMLKSLCKAIPFQKRNMATSFTRQLMRKITQEKHGTASPRAEGARSEALPSKCLANA